MVLLYRDSCQRGWKLLYIITAYYRCTEALKPYLLKFLQDVCAGTEIHFQGMPLLQHVTSQFQNIDYLTSHEHVNVLTVPGIAKACELNLRKTFQYGGRTKYPNNMELKAIMVSSTYLYVTKRTNVSLQLTIFCTLGKQELQTSALSSSW